MCSRAAIHFSFVGLCNRLDEMRSSGLGDCSNSFSFWYARFTAARSAGKV